MATPVYSWRIADSASPVAASRRDLCRKRQHDVVAIYQQRRRVATRSESAPPSTTAAEVIVLHKDVLNVVGAATGSEVSFTRSSDYGLRAYADGWSQKLFGFPIYTDGTPNVTVDYNVVTQKVSVTAKGGATSFKLYVDGVEIETASPWESDAHDYTTGNHFLYHDGTAFVWSTSAWDLMLHAPVALVYFEAFYTETGVCWTETHTTSRDPAIHRRLHEIEGTALVSGGTLSGWTVDTDTDAGVTFGIAETVIADEDLHTTIAALVDGSSYTIWYRYDASGTWLWDTSALPWTVSTYPHLNTYSAGTWDRRAMSSNSYGTFYVLATPAVTIGHGFIIIPGQTQYATEALADAELFGALALGTLPIAEFVLLAKVVVHARNSFGGTSKAKIKSVTAYTGTRVAATATTFAVHNTLPGRDDANAHPATAITNTPAGTITATTVQAAIDELAGEIAAVDDDVLDISTAELLRKFHLLLRAWIEIGLPPPPGLENDYEAALGQE